jgi:hypothetical protein
LFAKLSPEEFPHSRRLKFRYLQKEGMEKGLDFQSGGLALRQLLWACGILTRCDYMYDLAL